MKKKAIWMQDSALSHASAYSMNWLTPRAIFGDKIKEWPTFSPDLNCIEHFWSSLKKRIYAGGRQFTTNDTLWEALQDATRSFTPYDFAKYTNSINKMLFEVIPNHRNYINYHKFFSETWNLYIVITYQRFGSSFNILWFYMYKNFNQQSAFDLRHF